MRNWYSGVALFYDDDDEQPLPLREPLLQRRLHLIQRRDLGERVHYFDHRV